MSQRHANTRRKRIHFGRILIFILNGTKSIPCFTSYIHGTMAQRLACIWLFIFSICSIFAHPHLQFWCGKNRQGLLVTQKKIPDETKNCWQVKRAIRRVAAENTNRWQVKRRRHFVGNHLPFDTFDHLIFGWMNCKTCTQIRLKDLLMRRLLYNITSKSSVTTTSRCAYEWGEKSIRSAAIIIIL